MAVHHFNIEDAVNHGVEAAVLLYNLRFWLTKNKANKHNIHDGRVWTYNKQEAWLELFPYLTRSKVQRIIRDLHEKKLLLKANYNKDRFTKTTWYSLNEAEFEIENNTTENDEISPEPPKSPIARNRAIGGSKSCNRGRDNVQSLTDIKHISKTTTTTTDARDDADEAFQAFFFALIDVLTPMVTGVGFTTDDKRKHPRKEWLMPKAKNLFEKFADPCPADCAVLILKDWNRLIKWDGRPTGTTKRP